MNRGILFRGKRIDNGEWITGGYFFEPYSEKVYITVWNTFGLGFIESIEVDPSTVGQYTGLTDKNGKRVFEGDVFDWGYAGVHDMRYVVNYDAELAAFVGYRGFGFVSLNGIDIEIIGNIHDNPELTIPNCWRKRNAEKAVYVRT